MDFPLANIGHNLPTLWATVAGNLFDLGEATGLRLEHLALPPALRARFDLRVGSSSRWVSRMADGRLLQLKPYG